MSSTHRSWNPWITLEIDEHRTLCYGWANSQNRQCENPISASSHEAAKSLLSTISKLHPSFNDLETRLEILARHILCKNRFHQAQAAGVVDQWKENIEEYLELTEIDEAGDEEDVEDDTEVEIARLRVIRAKRRCQATASPSVHSGRFARQATEQRVIGVVPRVGSSTHSRLQPRDLSRPHTRSPNVPRTSPGDVSLETVMCDFGGLTIDPVRHDTSSGVSMSVPVATASDLKSAAKPKIQSYQAVSDDCPICCDSLFDGSALVYCKAQCRQCYHESCMKAWFHSQPGTNEGGGGFTCPNWSVAYHSCLVPSLMKIS